MIYLAIVLALVTLVAVVLYAGTRGGRAPVPLAVPVLAALAAVVVGVLACTTVVTAAVGVPVTFGKVGTPLEPGLHAKNPFSKIVKYPIRNSDTFCLGGDDGLVVKTAQQGQLSTRPCLSYRIDPKRAADIYLIARDADRLRDSIVQPYAQQAVTSTFSRLTNDEATATKLAELPDLVRADVAAALKEQGVELVTLTVPAPVPSKELQGFIDAKLGSIQRQEQAKIDQETAKTLNATRKETAQAQADANALIAASTTQAALCQQLINVLSEKGNIGVVMADPCSTGTAERSPVIVNTQQ